MNLRNGLYVAQYAALVGAGHGLVHLVDGRAWGGDMLIYYTGSYAIHPNGTFTARLNSAPYGDPRIAAAIGIEPIFGRAKNVLELDGLLVDDCTAEAEVRSKNSPGIVLKLRLSLLSE